MLYTQVIQLLTYWLVRATAYNIAVLYNECIVRVAKITLFTGTNGIFYGFARRKKRGGVMAGRRNGTRHRHSWRDYIYCTGSRVRSKSFGARRERTQKTNINVVRNVYACNALRIGLTWLPWTRVPRKIHPLFTAATLDYVGHAVSPVVAA